MRKLAWRLAFMAALTCLQALPVQAAEEVFQPTSTETPPLASPAPPAALPEAKPTPAESFASPVSIIGSEKKLISASAPGMDEFGRLLGYVTLLAALVGAAVYLIKFGLPMHRNRSKEERKLQVLEMRPLGNRQFLIVVGYEETRMLLGVTPGKIDYLCALDSPSSGNSDFAHLIDNAEKKGFAL